MESTRAHQERTRRRSWSKQAIALAIAFTPSACGSPPVATKSGMAIDALTIEEHFALTNDVRELPFRGAARERAVKLLDAHDVLSLEGRYLASGVVAQSRTVLIVRAADGHERRVTIEDCSEPHFCAFAREAKETGLVRKPFAVCLTERACTERR